MSATPPGQAGESGAIEPEVIEPIELVEETSAEPGVVWRILTEPADVARWFAEVTPVDGIGSPYRIDFGDGSLIDGTVREWVPGHRLPRPRGGEDEGPPHHPRGGARPSARVHVALEGRGAAADHARDVERGGDAVRWQPHPASPRRLG